MQRARESTNCAALDKHQIEFWLTAIVRMCRQLTGLNLSPVRVRFIHFREPPPIKFAELFGRDVEFGADGDDIAFAEKTRHLPVINADPYLNKLLVTHFEEAFSNKDHRRDSFRSKIENAVFPLLPHGKVTAQEIARLLGVGQRTLARRLLAEGLTFSELLVQLRKDLANKYLADRTLPISQVAWLLGYHEVSGFSHAFKRWNGKTPRE